MKAAISMSKSVLTRLPLKIIKRKYSKDLIVGNKIDILGLCKSLLKPDGFLAIKKAIPPNYVSSHVSREQKKCGEVALISNFKLKLKPKNIYIFTSIEVLLLSSPTNKTSSRLRFRCSIPPPRTVLTICR